MQDIQRPNPKFQPSKRSHQNLEHTPEQQKNTNLLAFKFQGDRDSHFKGAFEDTPDQQKQTSIDIVVKNENAQKIFSSQFALNSNKKPQQQQQQEQLSSNKADDKINRNLYYNSSTKKNNSSRLNSNQRQRQNQKYDDENNYTYNSNQYRSQQRSNQENLLNENNKSYNKKPKHFDTALNELEFNIFQEGINPQSQDKKSAIITQLLVSPKRINKVQKKKLASNKMYQDALCQRLYDEQKVFDENLEKKLIIVEEEEMKECYFQPNFNSKSSTGPVDFKAFLEGQVQFQKNVKDKRKHIEMLYKEQHKDELTHSPEICIKSEELVKNRTVSNEYGTNMPTHERLFKLSKIKNQQLIIGQKSPESKDFFVQSVKQKEEQNFQPIISEKSRNIQRSVKIDDLLYDDAKRRMQKQKLIDSYQSDTIKNLVLDQQPNTKITQNKTAKMIAERFVREFEFLASMYIGQDEEQKFDYITLGEVLYRMGFITNKEGQNTNSPIFAKERKLLFNLWSILKGDANQGVLKQNLCVFLLAILGILWKIPQKNQSIQSGYVAHALPKDSDREPFLQSSNFFPSSTKKQLDQLDLENKQFSQSGAKTDQKSQTQQSEILEKTKNLRKDEKLSFGRFNSNQFWDINFEEMRQLHAVYDLFYRNMLHSQEVKRAKYNWEPEYKPFILETSKMLAAGHREKILQDTANMIENQTLNVRIPENGKITHADLLALQRQAQIQQKKQTKEIQENEVFKSCTFKPNISISQSKQSFQSSQQQNTQFKSPKSQIGVNRSLQLYTLAKPVGTKRDKTTLEIEYEKNCDECTFAPDLNFSKGDKTYISKKQIYAKNIDKTIERMRAARAEKEVLDWWKEGRGYDLPTYESNRTKQSEYQENNEEPEESQQQQSQQQMPQETDNEEQIQNEENQIQQNQLPQQQEHQLKSGNDQNNRNVQENQQQNSQIPLLYVDVNLGQGRVERIIIYEGQKSEDLAEKFAQEHNLDDYMKQKLKIMIDAQIAGILHRIEEEMPSITSDVQESMRKEY